MPGSADASPYVVTLEEVGSNVVATGSGAIDATGLTPFESDSGIVSMPPNGTEYRFNSNGRPG